MNFEKYSSGQRQILRHIDRTKRVNYSNTNVDLARTGDNIRLSPDRASNYKYWVDTLNNGIHITRRSGANATVDLVCFCVSLPDELKAAEKEIQVEFFRASYDFILKRHFGESVDAEQWVVSAVIHYDEITADGHSTPHLHAALIPAVQTDKYMEGGWKCSCRDFMTKKDLFHWHDEFQEWVDERFNQPNGLSVKVKTGKTAGKNYSMDYFKSHRAEIRNERERERSREKDRQQPSWEHTENWGRDIIWERTL